MNSQHISEYANPFFFVSIIIPFRKKNPYLKECLEQLSHLTYRHFEVILLPDTLETFETVSFPLKALPTENIGPAQKRDIGCKNSKGSILAFIDDDAYPDPCWLLEALKHFKNKEIAAVTGPAATPSSDNFWQKASGLIYSTPLISGHCTHRYRPENLKEVRDAASVNLLVRKSDYIAVGGFNTHYYPGEDTKLCLDFVEKLKKKIIYEPKALVWHHRRALFFPHLKQVSQYALHRGFFIKHFPGNSLKLNYFLPSLFFFYTLLGPFLLFIHFSLFNLWWFSYLLYGVFLTAILIPQHSFLLSFTTTIGSFLTHFTYGFYFLKGLFSSALKR